MQLWSRKNEGKRDFFLPFCIPWCTHLCKGRMKTNLRFMLSLSKIIVLSFFSWLFTIWSRVCSYNVVSDLSQEVMIENQEHIKNNNKSMFQRCMFCVYEKRRKQDGMLGRTCFSLHLLAKPRKMCVIKKEIKEGGVWIEALCIWIHRCLHVSISLLDFFYVNKVNVYVCSWLVKNLQSTEYQDIPPDG